MKLLILLLFWHLNWKFELVLLNSSVCTHLFVFWICETPSLALSNWDVIWDICLYFLLQFMQRANRKEEKAKEEEVEPDENFFSPNVFKRKWYISSSSISYIAISHESLYDRSESGEEIWSTTFSNTWIQPCNLRMVSNFSFTFSSFFLVLIIICDMMKFSNLAVNCYEVIISDIGKCITYLSWSKGFLQLTTAKSGASLQLMILMEQTFFCILTISCQLSMHNWTRQWNWFSGYWW